MRPFKAIFRVTAGIVLILVGIVGLILPIMPGWALIIPGLILISDYFPPAKRLVDWGKRRVEEAKIRWENRRKPEQRPSV